MTAFENIVIGRSSIPSLIITVVLMTAIPVVFFLYWRGKHRAQTKIGWLIAGAVGFMVSARVLEDEVPQAGDGSLPVGFAFAGLAMCGVLLAVLLRLPQVSQ